MKAEIIAVGTELLLGQIANTNAQYISKKLAELGIDVYYHTVVGDNVGRLNEVVLLANSRSELIIFTGGLGPTKDDLTKETIARGMGKQLVQDDFAMKQIEAYFLRRGITMSENNRKQALVIEGSTIFPNDHGMAPGMATGTNGIHYLLFPGPPRELIPMFESYAVPYLQSLSNVHLILHSKVLRFYGIGESLLEEKLMDLIDGQSNPTIAPYAGEAEVTIRLTAKASNIEQANQMIAIVEKQIEERVGEFIYGYNDDSLPQVVFSKLKQNSWKLALAESCTGGLVSRMITAIPGSSEIYSGGVVCYSADVKQNVVGVPEETIHQYGTVSEETALAMANKIRMLMNADIGLAITGVAGPNESEGKPVGLVYIGISSSKGDKVYKLNLSGTREGIQIRAAKYGFYYLFSDMK
ncbi:MAG TPA: competence/damage-inducible protein A [Bacillota bacterium]|nr:competence/damage-inducible protein A [Bacillota bacterium]